MSVSIKRLTSSEIVLLAAYDLMKQGKSEFSEWELSEATWKRDPTRFGMRGFESNYPDHKRVMKEIMGKSAVPTHRGFLEKIRPNYYRLTALGRAEAGRLAEAGQVDGPSRSASDLYDAIVRYTDNRVFRAWLKDANEPRTWLGASAFFRLTKHDPAELNDRMREAQRCAQDGLTWYDEHKSALTRGPVGGGQISRAELQKLMQFIGVLEERFATQISAIRRRRINR